MKWFAPWCLSLAALHATPNYAVVVSAQTANDPAWQKVVAKLEEKHPDATRVLWTHDVTEALPSLAKSHPRHVAFVAQPSEATLNFVRHIHRLTRQFDADPYTDCLWGIVTGLHAADALTMAAETTPLVIRHTLSGTEIATDRCSSAQWFCELNAGKRVHKTPGQAATESTGPADSATEIAKALEKPETGLFITSGHATERDWQIGYRYRNGHWTSHQGSLIAVDLEGKKHPISSPHPKVYLAVGNCLMGHIDGPDAMALAFMHSAGVRQMAGYTLPTWYGYQGWGLLDYFLEQPGRFSASEAFIANNLALVHRLETRFPEIARENTDSPMGQIAKPIPLGDAAKADKLTPQDAQGLLFDRDTVAFYGDPAWDARLAPGPLNWQQSWQPTPTGGSLTLTPTAGHASFNTVNTNGSQRGGRPIIQFLKNRIDPATVTITQGAELQPVITDDFILIPLPPATTTTPLTLSFTAKPL